MSEVEGRFDRQVRFLPHGESDQARLASRSVLIVGCGALGGAAAESMVRMGVGRVVLADRDVVEHTNLPRQVLFTERQAQAGMAKVEAAQETLAAIGSPTRIEAHAVQVDAETLEPLTVDCDLVLDGTDNLTTRYLINEHCLDARRPWIHAAVIGSEGRVLTVLPGGGPCLCCYFPDAPAPGTLETCATAGVILPAVTFVSSLQVAQALRVLLADDLDELPRPALQRLDVWSASLRTLAAPARGHCPACDLGQRRFLGATQVPRTTRFCGRDAVQVRPGKVLPDYARLEELWSGRPNFQGGQGLFAITLDGLKLTLFPDGRGLVQGTADPKRAIALYERVLGS